MPTVELTEILGVQGDLRLRSVELRPRRRPVDATLQEFDAPLVIAEGAILRTVELQQRTGAELLGAGNVLVVGADYEDGVRSKHRVVAPTRLAVLDESRLAAIATTPMVLGGLLDAASRRTTAIAGQMVIGQLGSLDERLRFLLAELAERWGVVTPEGIVLPGFLSHTVLAALTASRRPSLTTAVVRLTEAGRLRRLPDRRWAVDPEFLGF